MARYKNMYYKLFRSQSKAIQILQAAQAETEQIYIDSADCEVVALTSLQEESKDNDE